MKSSLLFLALLTLRFSFSQPLCNDSERALLMQFKDSFAIEEFASWDPSAYPKTDSWGRNRSECCVWDGVECDGDSGHVIGLDLSNSFLYGSIDADSSLFGLTHLQTLNLAGNNFNYSQIPSSIERLSKLTLLDLSLSRFSGQIPYEILLLSRLVYLNLSQNGDGDYYARNLLELKNPGFHSLTESLTRLKHLDLNTVDISAGMPESLANLSSLEYLSLVSCRLTGEIPSSIKKLQHLRHLYLSWNNLGGQMPSLANLTQLEVVTLGSNGFESGNLSWLGSLTKISVFRACQSNLIGPLPSSLGNLTRLAVLYLCGNKLSGPIPRSLASLVNLEAIVLYNNNLSGEVDFGMFFGLKNLVTLVLNHNRLSVIIKPNINETIPQFIWLGLSSCNLIEFPKFLRHQKRLDSLELNYNRMGGNIPKWLWNTSTQTLGILTLEENFMGGYFPPILPFVNMRFLVVGRNSFTGPIPIPPPSIIVYKLNDNNFSGEIPPLFCNILGARDTTFSGKALQISTGRNPLEVLDLSVNKLQGKLPHSLANCTMLQLLSLEHNKLDDVFPHWLGTLPELQVLNLGSNRFREEIIKPQTTKSYFPQLNIVVLSHNKFSGPLPSQYFQCWEAMQAGTTTMEAKYSTASIKYNGEFRIADNLQISIKIKGVNRHYDVINEALSVVDLSNNNFNGEIPETIGILKGLLSLDLSNNNLSGHIPPSLENLTNLESLDLSNNRLSGEIPQELAKLTFLQFLNVSYNRLVGPIPQAGQLGTFTSTSFKGNSRLCGIPLQNKCEAPEPQPSSDKEEHEDTSSLFSFGWKVVAIGYVFGFAVGLLIAKIVVARRPRWFAMIFRVRIFK